MSRTPFLTTFQDARRISTPLIAITTQEPTACMRALQGTLDEDNPAPCWHWDLVRGFQGRNATGVDALDACMGTGDPSQVTNPTEMLELLGRPDPRTKQPRVPDDTLIFWLNAHRYLDARPDGASIAISQGLANLRDVFKRTGATLVLLGPSFTIPEELAQDVLVLDEPLPDVEDLTGLVQRTYQDAQRQDPTVAGPTPEVLAKAPQILRALSAFAAEQATAMCMRANGLNVQRLWDRKRSLIDATNGLSIEVDDNLVDGGGMDGLLAYMDGLTAGPYPPLVVVLVDEINDAMGGSQSDTSGVKQYVHSRLLQDMERYQWPGALFLGAPGTGKTLAAGLIGKRLGALTLRLDLGALLGGLVGESEANMRQAIKTIYALGGPRQVLWLGTTNATDNLTAQLQRRFKRRRQWYFPLPGNEEKRLIWQVQLRAYAVPEPSGAEGWPDDDGWVGSDIRDCAEDVQARGVTLLQAASSIIPLTHSDPEMIARMEALATGKFLNAADGRVYRPQTASTLPQEGRKLRV